MKPVRIERRGRMTSNAAQAIAMVALTSIGGGIARAQQPAPSASAPDSAARSVDVVTAATREYETTGAARTIVEGDVVTFPFGHSQPTLTCTVLRVCVIELQAGEIVLSRIAGDTERWEIVPASAGVDGRTTLIVVKPRDCDITTNLVLATDRRLYDLTLDAPPCSPNGKPSASLGVTSNRAVAAAGSATNPQSGYARHIRFYYPDETVAAWAAPKPVAPPTIAADVPTLNFRYHIEKDRKFPWTPAQVFDDGVRIYIKLPESARHAEAPVLFSLAADGARVMLNYNLVGGDTFVTDRIAERLALIVGIDGREQQLVIKRDEERH